MTRIGFGHGITTRPRRFHFSALLAAIAFHFAPSTANATDEIQVYNAEIAAPGQFTLQQHLNYVWNGTTQPAFPGGFGSNHTLNGTPELAYGVTDWFELGAYMPFSFDSDGVYRPGGVKFRQLFVSPHAEDRKYFYGLNIEWSYVTPSFSPNPVGLELRPILGVRDMGWELIVNPIYDIEIGPQPTSSFAPAARVAHEVAKDTWVGLEYYSDLGPFGAFQAGDDQQHNLFGVVDFKFAGFDINLGLGFGMTNASDGAVAKMILGRAF